MTTRRDLARAATWRAHLEGCAVILAALILAWSLKALGSRATPTELRWVLAPTTRLVEWLTGAQFGFEAQRGFVSREWRYEIVPACAGVNFMVVAFVSLVAGLVHTRPSAGGRIGLLAVAAVAAYATTLLANACRIAIAMAMHQAGTSFGPLTPDRLHVASGVLVYLSFLGAVFTIGMRATGADRDVAA